MAIRSGRFSFTGSDSRKILHGKKTNAILRLFNSGRTSFTVKNGDNTSSYELDPAFSYDFNGNGSGIVIEADAGDYVEGIYEYVSNNREVRSGRFDTLNEIGGAVNQLAYVKVADLGGLGEKVYYRFYNSGSFPIAIYIHNKNTAPTDPTDFDAELFVEQSVDLSIDKGPKVTIWVRTHPDHLTTDPDGDAGPIQPTDNPIQGIYEFLDIDS